jgi:hypothetical protein
LNARTIQLTSEWRARRGSEDCVHRGLKFVLEVVAAFAAIFNTGKSARDSIALSKCHANTVNGCQGLSNIAESGRGRRILEDVDYTILTVSTEFLEVDDNNDLTVSLLITRTRLTSVPHIHAKWLMLTSSVACYILVAEP